ncbi:Xaa-Pro dipeptidase [Marinobacter sp. CHS3-4]|uniref:Xaa-Pro dipeptidase n=1 Tax=Marinobacter sp. CHS3-4 TaxID=3045174 RepID=UPI0024B5436F|nr:Xaa-Pro dipeptidase [Marinobacter sp. CHS3-4]MDI9246459.1 Xaa-Pro dipeptidase [Marinobacter sp. CHS3-4]
MPEHGLLNLQIDHLDELQRRYESALNEHGFDGVLIASGAAPYRYGDDQRWHFQGYGPFLHWTGLTGREHSWLLIRTGETPILWLHEPVDFWHATLPRPEEPWLERMIVHTLAEAEPPSLPACGELAVLGDPAQIGSVPGNHNPEALIQTLNETRVRKTAYEVECLAEANRRALKGHEAARKVFQEGASEFEISLAYQQATGQREADAPYHSIIGVNAHAGTLHYQYYDTARPDASRSLLIDAGVRYRGYCSDITRTTAGEGERRFAALIHGLDQLQQRLCTMVTPGTDYADIHQKAHQGVAALLSASGLVTGLDDQVMVDEGITRAFFPHGVGHFLGVQVHDVSGKPKPASKDSPNLRMSRQLEEGMVVTIEPGLYIIPSLLDPVLEGPLGKHIDTSLVAELRGCGGIRIEDNVAVTVDGPRNLTRG